MSNGGLMKVLKSSSFILVSACFCILISCASMTPRHELFGGPQPSEDNMALFQIPHYVIINRVDEKAPSKAVKSDLWSQATTTMRHEYRETTFFPGLHEIVFDVIIGRATYAQLMLEKERYVKPFITAFEARKGYTYRIQSASIKSNYFAWIEETPKILERQNAGDEGKLWNQHQWEKIALAYELTGDWKSSAEETAKSAKKDVKNLP